MCEETENVVDISAWFEHPEHVPLCPICDQPMFDYMPVASFRAHGCVALAHVECISDARDEINT